MVRELKKLGHEVAISSSVGMPCTTLVWEGVRCFPDSGHLNQYGMDIIKTHYLQWGADIVISWLDAFAIPAEVAKDIGNWAAWIPVDSEPLMVRNIPALKECHWRIAPTRWGKQMLEDAGFENVMLLPCAYDPAVAHPLEKGSAAAREDFGKVIKKDLSGKFLVNVVSANSADRKNYQAIFSAWKIFHDRHPDALLYIHSDITGYFSSGHNLLEMARLHGVADDSVLFCSQWEYVTGQFGDDYLNLMYNASDVHLNTCYGEGFGLPIMEAQAAGCPTIVPDFAAASEVGLCYKVSKGVMRNTVPGAFQFMVDPNAVVEALELSYDARGKKELRMAAAELSKPWQVQNVVQDYLIPVLNRMKSEKIK
jgi:glycosyltransferase involved in cell wall biosynthesis